jgi:hypothetical protein
LFFRAAIVLNTKKNVQSIKERKMGDKSPKNKEKKKKKKEKPKTIVTSSLPTKK